MQKKYHCIIADDDEIDRLSTVAFCRRYPSLHIAGVFASGKEALAAALVHPPDVLLLDIDMPGMTGLELRSHLQSIPACIFITAYADFAVESFDHAALDFLVKPIRADRFAKTMERLEQYLQLHYKSGLLDYSLNGGTVFIKDGFNQVKLSLHEIIYLEALKDYTRIVTHNKKYCVHTILGNLLKQNEFQSFVRIHKSYAVQKNFISKITPREVYVKDIVLPLGRSYKPFLDFLKP